MTLDLIIFFVVLALVVAGWVAGARRSPSAGPSRPPVGTFNPGLIGRPGDDYDGDN